MIRERLGTPGLVRYDGKIFFKCLSVILVVFYCVYPTVLTSLVRIWSPGR